MGSIYKRIWTDKETGHKVKGDIFWISYYRNGKQYRESAKTTSLAEAKLLLEKKETDISREIQVTPIKERIKLSEWVSDVVKKLRISGKKSEPEATPSQDEFAFPVESSIEWQSPAPHAKASAVIGPTIKIAGNLTSEEDLLIEGYLDGKVEVRGHSITVGKKGQVKADIYGRIIVVEGTVEGNLHAEEQLIIRDSGNVLGKIESPRVSLEDGSIFNGTMEMSRKDRSLAMTAPQKPIAGIEAT
jgi:cytoskeletal protein CcmA (bactofilin family)